MKGKRKNGVEIEIEGGPIVALSEEQVKHISGPRMAEAVGRT